MITASKAGLARQCRAWEGMAPDASGPSRPAARGTAMHLEIEAHLRGGTPCREAWRAMLAVATAGASRLDIEAAYVSRDGVSAERVALPAARMYPPGYALGGTADLIVWRGDCPTIIDWKTGSDVGLPSRLPQLRWLAWLAVTAHAAEVPRCHVAVGRVTDDAIEITTEELPPDELVAIDDEIQATLRLDAAPRVGAHCAEQWCPSMGACPAQVARRAAWGIAVPAGPIETAEEAREWLDAWAVARKLADRRDGEVKALADAAGGALRLGDGTAYVRGTQTTGGYSVPPKTSVVYRRKKAT